MSPAWLADGHLLHRSSEARLPPHGEEQTRGSSSARLVLGGALVIADPAGSSARWPSATAHAITAEIRCRTRFAVVGLVAHIGVRAAITSALVIRSTHFDPITGDT